MKLLKSKYSILSILSLMLLPFALGTVAYGHSDDDASDDEKEESSHLVSVNDSPVRRALSAAFLKDEDYKKIAEYDAVIAALDRLKSKGQLAAARVFNQNVEEKDNFFKERHSELSSNITRIALLGDCLGVQIDSVLSEKVGKNRDKGTKEVLAVYGNLELPAAKAEYSRYLFHSLLSYIDSLRRELEKNRTQLIEYKGVEIGNRMEGLELSESVLKKIRQSSDSRVKEAIRKAIDDVSTQQQEAETHSSADRSPSSTGRSVRVGA